MAGFADKVAKVDAAVRAHLTDPALWRVAGAGPAVAVSVVLEEPTVELRLGQTRGKADTALIQVFRVDVAEPAKGDTCQLTGSSRLFKVTARPDLDAEGTLWTCEAAEVTP
jgi:hypothetical protein